MAATDPIIARLELMTGAQARMLDDIENQLSGIALTNLTKGLVTSFEIVADETTKAQEFVAKALDQRVLPDRTRKKIHQEAGDRALRSLIAGYTNRRRRRNTPTYRTAAKNPKNVRLAGGVLRRALSRPEMVKATANSLLFIDTQMLDREAAHWRRINFGAGKFGAGSTPAQFKVHWGSLVLGSIGLIDQPSPAFKLPGGFWYERQFYPRSEKPKGLGRGRKQKPVMTFGIVGAQFLDAGVRRLAEEIPRGYVEAFEHLYRTDRVRFNRAAQQVNVDIKVFRPGGPSQFRVPRPRY